MTSQLFNINIHKGFSISKRQHKKLMGKNQKRTLCVKLEITDSFQHFCASEQIGTHKKKKFNANICMDM